MAVSSFLKESSTNLSLLSHSLPDNIAATADSTFENQKIKPVPQIPAATFSPENDKSMYGSDTFGTGERESFRSSIRNKVYSGLRLDTSILEASALRLEKIIENSSRNKDSEGFREKEEKSNLYSEIVVSQEKVPKVMGQDEDWENLPSRYWLALSEKETEEFPRIWPNCQETYANGVKKQRLTQDDSCVLLDELKDFCSMERIIAAQGRMQSAARDILEAEMQVQRLQKMEEETNKVTERTKDVTQKRRASSSPRQRVFWLVDWISGRTKTQRERN